MKRTLELTICCDTLPPGMHGAIMTTGAGQHYIIVTNQQETENQQAAAFLHECLHLFHGDLNGAGGSADEIEAARHAEIIELLEILKKRANE